MKIVTLITVFILSCSAGLARTITYDTGLFDHLAQTGNINIVFKSNPDSVGMVTYDSDRDYSDAIEITNSKGHLVIKEVPGHDLGPIPTLHVYSDIIYQIKSEGDAEIRAYITSATPTLSINLVGNGDISCSNINTTDLDASITTGHGTIALQGKCTSANFKLTGTGTIQADQLSAQNIKCTTLGTGTIGCNPAVSLETRGLGSTKIYYSGNPKIKKIGNAKLLPLEQPSPVPTTIKISENEDTPTGTSNIIATKQTVQATKSELSPESEYSTETMEEESYSITEGSSTETEEVTEVTEEELEPEEEVEAEE